MRPLDRLPSLKLKLGVVLVAAVAVTLLVNELGLRLHMGALERAVVAAGLALALVQLLAHGMTAPLRQMAVAARAMAVGDTTARVEATSRDEVGQLAEAFNAMAAELAEVDRVRRDLVANVSHELRTPLGALQAQLENVADGVQPADPETVRTMLRQVERLSRLVSQLLDLSRLESGTLELDRRPFEVGELLDDVAAEARLAGGGVTVTVHVEGRPMAVGDRERVHQVLANLVENAVRHSPADGTVALLASEVTPAHATGMARGAGGPSAGGVRFEVLDDGPGIADDDRGRVFERFYRADAARAAASGGAGLGLAIARWIVDLHGGSIRPEPRHPHGCRMIVVLPSAATHLPGPAPEAGAVTPAAWHTPAPPVADRRETPVSDTTPLPPSPLAPWADLTLERPADGWVLVAVLAGAVLTDLATRSGVACVAGSALVALVAAAMLSSGRLVTGQSRAVVAIAALFGVFLSLRMSPSLVPFDVLAAGAALVLAASLARAGDVTDLTFPGVLSRAAHVLAHGLAGPAFAAGALDAGVSRPATGGRIGPGIARGVALAAPVVVLLGVLLASADAVFASFFRFSADPANVAGHVVLLLIGGWGVAGLLRAASSRPLDTRVVPRMGRPLRPVESLTVLACLVGLYSVFAVAQLVALSGSGQRVLRTAGLTYAEYARSGFFQLLGVAAITLVVLMALRAATTLDDDRSRRRFVLLAELAVGLTIGIVIVAVHRLALYEHAYGLTMLRLYSTVFAVWVGVVFLLLGLSLAGVGRRRAWFLPLTALTAVVTLIGLNVVNPEALVVRHDVAFLEGNPNGLDPSYLTQLSDDAVPTLVAALPRLDPSVRDTVVAALCQRDDPPFRGWASVNASRRAADAALDEVCPPGR